MRCECAPFAITRRRSNSLSHFRYSCDPKSSASTGKTTTGQDASPVSEAACARRPRSRLHPDYRLVPVLNVSHGPSPPRTSTRTSRLPSPDPSSTCLAVFSVKDSADGKKDSRNADGKIDRTPALYSDAVFRYVGWRRPRKKGRACRGESWDPWGVAYQAILPQSTPHTGTVRSWHSSRKAHAESPQRKLPMAPPLSFSFQSQNDKTHSETEQLQDLTMSIARKLFSRDGEVWGARLRSYTASNHVASRSL